MIASEYSGGVRAALVHIDCSKVPRMPSQTHTAWHHRTLFTTLAPSTSTEAAPSDSAALSGLSSGLTKPP